MDVILIKIIEFAEFKKVYIATTPSDISTVEFATSNKEYLKSKLLEIISADLDRITENWKQ